MTRLADIAAALRRFAQDDRGTATVDFVVGTAAGLALALAVTDAVGDGVMALSDTIATRLAEQAIPDYGGEGEG